MLTNPLVALELASIIQAERLAEAEQWRRAARVRRARASHGRNADGPVTRERHLGSWLAQVGDVVAGLSNDALEGRRPALEAFVGTAMHVARESGVDVGITLEAGQPSTVLNRAIGTLAERTAARPVPVSRRDAARLEAALRVITGEAPPPDPGWELAA
jgi:hypothetical protein